MFNHAHDEYGTHNQSPPPQRTQRRTASKPKRPARPKRNATQQPPQEGSPHDGPPQEGPPQEGPPQDGPPKEEQPNNFKYRGKGKTADNKKPNPWTHAHDEYAQPKTNKKAKTSRNKPHRIRFETADGEDDDTHPEEKSNRPLKKKIPRRPKKAPSYVSAANIHAQQFRSANRVKPLPPAPKMTNQQRVAFGKSQFDAMIQQAAAKEGLDRSDVRVQRMIKTLGDQMSGVSGFNRFLQNKDAELSKIVNKQNKRRKTVSKLQRNMMHERTPSPMDDDEDVNSVNRKGSVKDLAARWEKKSVDSGGRRHRHKNRRGTGHAHRNALKLPNTKSHRRRVSSQFSVAAINAVLSANSSKNPHSPYEDRLPMGLTLEDNISNISGNTTNTLNTLGHEHNNTLGVSTDGRRMSRDSRASFSRGSRLSVNAPSVIMLDDRDSNQPRLIITTPSPDGDDSEVAHSVGGDPLKMLVTVLQREPGERTEEEIDILVSFFENYQIMTEDVDTWSGKATFRSFICQTRYEFVAAKNYVFREGDDGDVFYFVLRGNVSVLVDDASTVHAGGSKRNMRDSGPKLEIHTVEENHVFGEIAMFNQGKRSATCVAKTDTYLAYWDRSTYDTYIRPMKELKKKAEKILRDKQGNMLSDDQLIEKAAMFLDDAVHGRELKMHRNGPWPRRIHKLINHKYFNYCLVMVSMLYLSLIFMEPPSWRDSNPDELNVYSSRIMPLIAFEWFVFLIFFSECALRFYSFGSSWFFTIDLHVARVILLIIFACDLMIACIYNGHALRFSRFIRPIFPILFIRDLRRQYYIVLACIPYIIELIFLWIIIASIFARIGYHIFYHAEGHLADGHTRVSLFMRAEFEKGWSPYDDKMSQYCFDAEHDTTETLTKCSEFFEPFVWQSFNTFFKSFIALFGLLTTENFPEIWWPTWLSNHGKAYWGYFVIYMLIAVFFLLNLFSAAVYDAYQHIISKLDVIDEGRETQALKVAWICLDTGDRGCIGPQKFENLMFRLKPEYTEFEIGVIFKLLDPDNNHLIDAEDFSVMMINVLYLSISRKVRSKDDDLKLYLQKLGGSCPFAYELIRVFTSQRWRLIMLVVQFIDIFALVCYHQFVFEFNIIDFCCILIILFALVLDVIFKHMSDLATYFKSSRNQLYFGLTFTQTIGTFIGIVDDRIWLSALRFFGILRILIVAIFLVEKIKFLRSGLTRTLTQTVIFMIPVFLRICVYTSVVLLYVYTVIGTEIFVDPDRDTWGTNRCHAPSQLQNDPYALFCDANMAIITLTQILTTNNWHIIMYTAILVTDNWMVATYFITFFFLGPILVLSLLLAMFFNMFFGVTMQSEHELSAYLQETDIEARHHQEHMELQEIQQQHMEQQHIQIALPTECGISTLPNGSKVLTVMKYIVNDEEEELEELVHIPLHNVARDIWENIPGADWMDQASNNIFKQTFTGREATLYLLNANFAPTDEEAVDTLSVIMDEIGAFMRVDPGKEQEFENDADAHYQWIIIPDDEDMALDDVDAALEEDENDEVALDDIMIGFRHSYGGYHRLLKQYRQAGIDPTQESARAVAERTKEQMIIDTPISTVIDPKPNSPQGDTPAELVSHLRNQSQKLKVGFQKLTKTGNTIEESVGIDSGTVIKLNIIDDTVANNNNDTAVIAFNSNSSNLHNHHPSRPSPSHKSKPKPITISRAISAKDATTTTTKLKSGNNTHNINNHEKTDSKRNLLNEDAHDDNSNHNNNSNLTKSTSKARLTKSQSKSNVLIGAPNAKRDRKIERTASSKNILLRHLDSKPRKNLF